MTEWHTARLARYEIVGGAALTIGAVLAICNGIEEVSGLSGAPRFFVQNRLIWWVLSLILLAGGSLLLAQLRRLEEQGPIDQWRPSTPGVRFRQLMLYTRVGCHLCDEARDVLEAHARWLPRIIEVDVDTDPRLIDRFGKCVPVVVLDGKVRFKGRVAVPLLRRLIQGTGMSPIGE